jgi:hypothetical protein
MLQLAIVEKSIFILKRLTLSGDQSILPMMTMAPRHFRLEFLPISEFSYVSDYIDNLSSLGGLMDFEVDLAHAVRDILNLDIFIIAAMIFFLFFFRIV